MVPSPTPNPRLALPRLLSSVALLLFSIPGASPQNQPSPAVDAAALIRRAVANHMRAEAAHHPQRFVIHKKDDKRDFVQEIIETQQGDIAMAIAASGKPLNPDMRQTQIDRLNNLDAHPELQEHRHKREQEDNARVDKLMRLLPDAFLYHYDSTVSCTVNTPPDVSVPGVPPPGIREPSVTEPGIPESGIPESPSQPTPAPSSTAPAECYHLTFTPSPNWNPPDIEAKIMRGMAGEAWIEKSQERLTRLDAHLIADVDFGWGFIGRLNKGGTIFLEQTEVARHDWELTRMKLNFTGKGLMVKTLNINLTEEMAHYAPVPTGLDYHKAIQILESDSSAPPKIKAPSIR